MTALQTVEGLRETLEPFARQNPHKNEDGSVGILVPATVPDVRRARAALAAPVDDTWLPIASAPDLDRVWVCGWQKPHGSCAGYWWWHEDVCFAGKGIEYPDALLWCPIHLPAFPTAPAITDGAGS